MPMAKMSGGSFAAPLPPPPPPVCVFLADGSTFAFCLLHVCNAFSCTITEGPAFMLPEQVLNAASSRVVNPAAFACRDRLEHECGSVLARLGHAWLEPPMENDGWKKDDQMRARA